MLLFRISDGLFLGFVMEMVSEVGFRVLLDGYILLHLAVRVSQLIVSAA